MGYSISPVQVRASERLAGNRSKPLDRCEVCPLLWGCSPVPSPSNRSILLSAVRQLHFQLGRLQCLRECCIPAAQRLCLFADYNLGIGQVAGQLCGVEDCYLQHQQAVFVNRPVWLLMAAAAGV